MDQYPSQQPPQSPYPQPPQYSYPQQAMPNSYPQMPQNDYPQSAPQYPYPPQPPQNSYPRPSYPMQQQPKPKRRGCLMGGVITVIVVIAIIAVAVASSGKASTNNTGTSSSGTGAATTSDKTFNVGDVVTVGSTWQVTVNSLKTSTGDNFDQPKAGNTFLEVSVTLKNLSSQEQAVSSLVFWTLKDATGQQYTEAIVTSAPATPDGKVAAGDKLTGTLSYEVPQAQKQFELAFTPDLTSSGQTIWNLKP